jgi:hypothetical protein
MHSDVQVDSHHELFRSFIPNFSPRLWHDCISVLIIFIFTARLRFPLGFIPPTDMKVKIIYTLSCIQKATLQ